MPGAGINTRPRIFSSRMRQFILFFLLLLIPFLAGCTAEPTPVPEVIPLPSLEVPVPDTSAGEPRTAGYWLLWNACAAGNMAETARLNGGRQMGWIILDDLLAYPGIVLGDYRVDSCAAALELLNGRMLDGTQTQDPVHSLAAALLTAELNRSAGAEDCQAVEAAAAASHVILAVAGFNGMGEYSPALAEGDTEAIPVLTVGLAQYNLGNLCK